ncbi:diguanylate cyclase [Pseudidiomarina donghaiensis]|uniref:diguanylate cyclase n=1 Tax=Pseudidiomarina donghaiensis TaxID=519452 RepID=UPI003A97D7BC
MNLRKRTVAGILSLFAFGLLIVIYLTSSVVTLLDDRFRSERVDELHSQFLLAKSNLESNLFRDVFLVDSLATVFNIDPKSAAENFDEIGSRLLQKSKHVRSIGMGPNDVLNHIIPLEGNEKAIGLDFRTVPEQYKTIITAREQGDIYLAGPVDLVQGGRGLIARIPVFNDYPVNLDYWGTVSVVIDYEKLINDAGLFRIQNSKVAIRGLNGTGKSGQVFEGDEALFNVADYSGKLLIPNGEWWIAVEFFPILEKNQTLFLALVRWGSLLVYVLLFGLVTLLWAYYLAERQRANADSLTHLVNRRFTLDYLNRRFTDKNPKDNFFVVAIDLNYFKEINDNLGHYAGDEVLRCVAQRMQAAVRSTDLVARMGGDEFLVVLNRIRDSKIADTLVAKIRQTVEGSEFVVDDLPIHLSISVGVACSTEEVNSVDGLLKLADARMYENKAAIKEHCNAPKHESTGKA